MKLQTFLAAALLTATFSHAATLPASEDSYGFRAKLTLAANKAATLPVDATHRAFVYFNLADLPAGAQIRYARLRLYLPRVVRAGSGLGLHQVTGTWDESLASAEPTFTATPLANFTTGLVTKRFISVDVTPTVQAWLTTPTTNEGFAIAAIPGVTAALTASVSLGAKEGTGSGYPAELEVEIATDPVAAGAIGTTQLAAGAVQSGNIALGAVGSTQLATGAVQSSNIASGAVGATALADGSVTTPKIATSAVTDEKIVSISGAKVSGAVASATNAGTVNGIGASTTPTPNTLLSLNANGKFPSSVVSFGSGGGFDADLLDGLDSLAFAPATGSTAYVSKSGDTMNGNLTVNGTVSISSFTSSGDADMKGNILKNSALGMLLWHPSYFDGTTRSGTLNYLARDGYVLFDVGGDPVTPGTGIVQGQQVTTQIDKAGTFLSARFALIHTPVDGHTVYVVVGTPGSHCLGFKCVATALKGVTSIGGVETEVDLATPTNSGPLSVLAVRRAATVEFYVDGLLKGTSSTNLPNSATGYTFKIINSAPRNPPSGGPSQRSGLELGFMTIGVPMF